MRALVIGADSAIGASLVAELRRRGDHVTETTRRSSASHRGAIFLDLADPGEHDRLCPTVDVAFICAAMTNLDRCRLSPDLAMRINCLSPIQLVKELTNDGSRVVFISTPAVFDCLEPLMRADRPRHPTSVYGKTKALAEEEILCIGRRANVVRLTKVITEDNRLLSRWTSDLRAGRPIYAYEDHRVAPIAMSHVVETLLAVGSSDEDGIFQVSGSNDVSYHEIARYMADKLGVSPMTIRGLPAQDGGLPPEHVLNFTSLDVDRLKSLTGYRAPDAHHIIDMFLEKHANPAE